MEFDDLSETRDSAVETRVDAVDNAIIELAMSEPVML